MSHRAFLFDLSAYPFDLRDVLEPVALNTPSLPRRVALCVARCMPHVARCILHACRCCSNRGMLRMSSSKGRCTQRSIARSREYSTGRDTHSFETPAEPCVSSVSVRRSQPSIRPPGSCRRPAPRSPLRCAALRPSFACCQSRLERPASRHVHRTKTCALLCAACPMMPIRTTTNRC